MVFYDFNHGTANETGGVIREPYLIFMNNTDSMDWDSAGNIYESGVVNATANDTALWNTTSEKRQFVID